MSTMEIREQHIWGYSQAQVVFFSCKTQGFSINRHVKSPVSGWFCRGRLERPPKKGIQLQDTPEARVLKQTQQPLKLFCRKWMTQIYIYMYIYIHTHLHTIIYIYYHIIWHSITLHYITLYYIILHYIILYYITLHYIILYYITPSISLTWSWWEHLFQDTNFSTSQVPTQMAPQICVLVTGGISDKLTMLWRTGDICLCWKKIGETYTSSRSSLPFFAVNTAIRKIRLWFFETQYECPAVSIIKKIGKGPVGFTESSCKGPSKVFLANICCTKWPFWQISHRADRRPYNYQLPCRCPGWVPRRNQGSPWNFQVLHEQSHRFPSLWEIYAHFSTFLNIQFEYVYIYIYMHIYTC